MKRTTVILTALVAAAMLLTGNNRLHADHIFLKDGSITEASIITENTAVVTARLKDGRVVTYSRNNILRVVYTQLYMGKLYINMVDGRVIECYIVDEDRENYTMRMDINKPAEFTVRRTDVLFMVRKNPSALAGKVSQKHVDLDWKPPYNPVKYYKVYVKTKTGAYKLAGESRSTRHRVKGLNCNMEYTAMVTAVDRENYESLPSNEVQILTEKGKPSPPSGLKVAKITSDKNQVYTALLSWDRAEDPCGGTINDYCVYLKAVDEIPQKKQAAADKPKTQETGNIPAGYRLAGKSSGSTFTISGLRDNTSYSILMTSVDNTKDESAPGREITFDTGKRRPQFPYPVACEKDISKDKKELTARLSWEEVRDPFRRIAAYRVFRRVKGRFEPAGTAEKPEFEAAGLSPSVKHVFMVRAVDVRGVESENSYLASTGLLRYVELSARGSGILPMREYGRLYRPGYGVSLSLSVRNPFFEGISLGAEAGYGHLTGRTKKSRYTALVPFMGTISYRWQPLRWFSIDPKIAIGGSYNMSDKTLFIGGSVESYLFQRYVKTKQVELMFSAGTNVTFIIKKYILLQAGAEYCGIIENKRLLDFIRISGGAGYSF